MPRVDVFRKSSFQLTKPGQVTVNQEIALLLRNEQLVYHSDHIELSSSLRSTITGSNALHYIVWEYFCPRVQIPHGHYLAHRDGDNGNTRVENLVIANESAKSAIAPKRRDNTTGFKDVFTKRERYASEVTHKGKSRYCGVYDTISEAAYAVNLAYSLLYQELPPPNRIPADDINFEQEQHVETTVQRLFRPSRLPGHR
jgi:hypothetical protein